MVDDRGDGNDDKDGSRDKSGAKSDSRRHGVEVSPLLIVERVSAVCWIRTGGLQDRSPRTDYTAGRLFSAVVVRARAGAPLHKVDGLTGIVEE